jgi:hypothetical protein
MPLIVIYILETGFPELSLMAARSISAVGAGSTTIAFPPVSRKVAALRADDSDGPGRQPSSARDMR